VDFGSVGSPAGSPRKEFAMKGTRLCMMALVLLALTSAACSRIPWAAMGRGLLAQDSRPPAPASQSALFPRGRFSSVTAPNMVLLTIENDGQFRLFLDNALLDSGKFDVDGPQVLVESITCAGEGEKPALYNWLYDDEDGLVFQAAAADPCPERRQYLSEEYLPKYTFVFSSPDRGISKAWLW
jgi:hypothetical protein